MRAMAGQATKGLLLRLRPYSRPVGVAPRQRQNHAKHNPIKYDAPRFAFFLTIGFTRRFSAWAERDAGLSSRHVREFIRLNAISAGNKDFSHRPSHGSGISAARPEPQAQ